MTGRLLAPVLAGAFLALAPLAAGSGQALSATGTISGSGGSYTLTLKNTGDETINCLSLFAPAGVTVTTASGPSQTLRFSDGTGFGYGGGQGIAPGADAAFTFTTDKPYPADQGRLQVSADCQSNIPAELSGPAPPPLPCECAAIRTAVTRTGLNFSDTVRFRFQLVWTMACTGGTGQCRGTIVLHAPAGFRIATPRKTAISCAGTCAAKASRRLFVGGTWPVRYRNRRNRANRTFVFRFAKTCLAADGTARPLGSGALTIRENARGLPASITFH